jgi:hypothetical protein
MKNNKKKLLVILLVVLLVIIALVGAVVVMVFTGKLALTDKQKLTKGLYLYKAESLRPRLYITPNVIKFGETKGLAIDVFGADNELVERWYNNDDYAITINGNP